MHEHLGEYRRVDSTRQKQRQQQQHLTATTKTRISEIQNLRNSKGTWQLHEQI